MLPADYLVESTTEDRALLRSPENPSFPIDATSGGSLKSLRNASTSAAVSCFVGLDFPRSISCSRRSDILEPWASWCWVTPKRTRCSFQLVHISIPILLRGLFGVSRRNRDARATC